jgi:SP family facilitated glucose transporter-like MFS transporter 1
MLAEPLLGDDGGDDKLQWVRLFATVSAVALGSSLQFGYATGSLNNLEQIVPADLASHGNPIVMWQWALINSMFSVGGLLGSYGVVVPLAYFGRQKTLLLANVFVFAASAFMYFGTVWWMLVLGRVCIGVVAGVAQMVAGAYMTEISPIAVRGSVGVCSQVGIVLGISLASFLTAPSFAVFGTLDKWRYTFLVPCGFSIFQLIVLPFCPKSPAYLIKSQGEEATWATLKKLHRELSAANHMNALRNELKEGGKATGKDDMSIYDLLCAKNLRKQLLVGIVIKIGVQFSGIDAIFYYSTLMFRHAHVADPQMSTFLLSLVNVAMTFIALTIMEKAGRRPLLMCTWVGMCCGFFSIWVAGTLGDVYRVMPALMSNLQVVAMVLTIVSFAVGVGNVEGFIISEIMPVYAKDTLASIGQPLNWIANLTVSTGFPLVFQALGRNTYLLFVGLTMFFGWFTFTRVPETKGKTIAQVTKDFEKY